MRVESGIRLIEEVKDVPYPIDIRADSIGYGFKDLKGKPELVSTVPEVSLMQGMQKALRELCRAETPFFSIGCEQRVGEAGTREHWAKGFIEFAYNFEPAARYENYRTLLANFKESGPFGSVPAPAIFDWVVAPVRLTNHQVLIHSCSVWITARGRKRPAKARKALDESFEALGVFLGTVSIGDHDLSPLF